MINGADTPKPILVLDFDGTLCVGDAPVWAYADAVLANINGSGSPGHELLRHQIRTQLEAFLDGTSNPRAHFSDGYDAVAQLTSDYTTPERLQAAYVSSRRALASGALAVHAPSGLKEFLSQLRPMVTVVLVTNAPEPGIRETIATLGLTAEIDRIVTDADKPSGWEHLIPELLVDQDLTDQDLAGQDLIGRAATTVMVVGDIWSNDIAVPLRLGCATAYIDRFDQRQGAAHVIARDFPSLYPDIRQWAHDPAGFVTANPAHQPSESSVSSVSSLNASPNHRTGTQ